MIGETARTVVNGCRSRFAVPSLELRFLRPSNEKRAACANDDKSRLELGLTRQTRRRARAGSSSIQHRLLNQIPNCPERHRCGHVTESFKVACAWTDAELHHLRRRTGATAQPSHKNTHSWCALASSSKAELGVIGYPAQGHRFTI